MLLLLYFVIYYSQIYINDETSIIHENVYFLFYVQRGVFRFLN